ncbi:MULTISPECIES: hypothetical protein [Streptomyces]|uniref:hypothetical protein n=1 Tax=Streptomyces TaxID=1883 RepID=UPI0004CBB91B|nr:hypothetical protein [Streptomyces anulatus]
MSSSRSVRGAMAALRGWTARRWAAAITGALATAAITGVPTAVVPTPWFSRSVPVQWWNYPAWAVTAALAGLVLATYVAAGPSARPTDSDSGRRLGYLGGVLSFLAIGCPVCNKVVLLLVGASGALSYWAPLQPLVAVASVVLLAEAALRRLATEASCPVPAVG